MAGQIKYTLSLFVFVFLLSACSSTRKVGTDYPAAPYSGPLRALLQTPALQNAHVGISIYNADEDSMTADYQGDKYFVPASNTKIPTCYAAMKFLGDSTLTFRYAENDTAIFIEPGGDPSFMHRDYLQQPAIEWLKAQGKSLYFLDHHWQTQGWGSGWSWGDYEAPYMAERSPMPVYGNTIRWEQLWAEEPYDNTLVATITSEPATDWPVHFSIDNPDSSFKVRRAIGDNSFTIYEGKEGNPKTDLPFVTNGLQSALPLLADSLQKTVRLWEGPLPHPLTWRSFYSQPIDSILRPMMHRSDNFMAEQLLLMVSYKLTGRMRERLATDSLMKTEFSGLPQPPRWADGSGLSRYNLFTPQDFVSILKKIREEIGMERIKTVFPAGGKGTLSNYYISETPYLYAKTGTLSGVVALSGYLTTTNGKTLIFSVLVNNHQASATEIRKAVEAFLISFRDNL